MSIKFSPVEFRTFVLPVEVHVSQFGFEPFVIQVVGNAMPGVTRDRLLAAEGERRIGLQMLCRSSFAPKMMMMVVVVFLLILVLNYQDC